MKIQNLVLSLTISRLTSPKRSCILKQTCYFQQQVSLSMFDLLVDTRGYRVKNWKDKKSDENARNATVS